MGENFSANKDYGFRLSDFVRSVPVLLRSRLEAIFIWSWCTTITTMVIGRGFPPVVPSLMVIGSVACIAAAVYLYNDLVDAEMDRLNTVKVKRPMAAGSVSESSAMVLIVGLGFVGLTLSFFVNLPTFLITLGWMVLFTIYSHPGIRLKKMFIVKELVCASGWPLCSLAGSFALTGTFSLPALFASLLLGTFSFLGMPALSDAFDEYEDGLYGVKTMARVLNWKRKVQLLGLAVLVMMTVTPLTYAQLGFSVILPISVVALSLMLLRLAISPIMDKFELQTALRARKLTYLYFILTQILIVISSLNLGIKLF